MRYLAILSFMVLLLVPVHLQAAPEGYRTVSAQAVADAIMDQGGQRRVLFLYTSWCPYCRAALPEMIKLSQSHPGAIVALSVDEQPENLVQYMKRYDAQSFPLMVWDREADLPPQLGRFGIKLTGGIPFFALLDETGQVYKQGNIDVSEAVAYLNAVKPGAVEEL